MDNTWGIHLFQPFQHGVDVSIQALTKYAGGHSDVLIGSVTVNHDEDWRTRARDRARARPVRQPGRLLADAARHAHHGACGWTRRWRRRSRSRTGSRRRPEVKQVLHPGAARRARARDLEARLHRRLQPVRRRVPAGVHRSESTHAFVEALELFGIGASWGGYESLALPTTGFVTRTAGTGEFGGPVVRLHIGLEDVGGPDRRSGAGLEVMREFGR